MLLYSVILTRSCSITAKDMDEHGSSSLIGTHDYCSMELVNLLLTGCASSNVLDGLRDLGGGAVLKGVKSRARVGLLTLLEWYRWVTSHMNRDINSKAAVHLTHAQEYMYAKQASSAAVHQPMNVFFR